MSRSERRVALALIGVAATLGALVLIVVLLPREETLNEKDFGQEYLLALAILNHVDPYQPVRDLGARYVVSTGNFDKAHPTPHPPTVGLLALPFALLSYPNAASTWFVFELVCLGGAVALLRQATRVPFRARMVPLVALALVAWPPATLELGLGQLMLPLLVGLAGALLAFREQRSTVAGGLLGLTLLIKPIALPWLMVLAWRRQWRALAATASVGLLGGALSIAAIGWASALDYVSRVLPSMSAAFFAEPTNLSLWTLGVRLGFPALEWVAPAGVMLAMGWWACTRLALVEALGLMTVASLLASPITWYFYLVLALLPLAVVCAAVWRRGPRRGDVVAAAIVFTLLSVSQGQLTDLDRLGAGGSILLEPALALGLLGLLLAWSAQGAATNQRLP